MARKVLAIRYAKAAFGLAEEQNQLDGWHQDLKTIAGLSEDGQVLAFLESPRVHFDDKVRLLKERLGDLNPLVLNLVYLLIAKGRADIVADITREYERLLDSHRGVEQALVTTAARLSVQDEARLKQRLAEIVGKKIVLKTAVDPSLISGMMARVGDKLIDGSTRSKLGALKRELSQGRI